MKLDRSHFGKKMTIKDVFNEFYFIPLAQTSKGDFVGEDYLGNGDSYVGYLDKWEFYEEPKKPVRMEYAPCVIRLADNCLIITGSNYKKDEAQKIFGRDLISWPAPFDPVRGVWYYEEIL